MNHEIEMSEAAREAERKYYREYRAKNKEKIKRNKANYWERKALRIQQEAEQGATGGATE